MESESGQYTIEHRCKVYQDSKEFQDGTLTLFSVCGKVRKSIEVKGLRDDDPRDMDVDAQSPGQRIQWLIDFSGLTNTQFAEAAGIGSDTMSKWVNDRLKKGSHRSNLQRIAEVFNYPAGPMIAFIEKGTPLEPMPKPPRIVNGRVVVDRRPSNWPEGKIPLVGKVPASNGATAFNDYTQWGTYAESFIDRGDKAGANAMAFKVIGDSMEPTLFEGDVVVADPDVPIKGDCIVVVQMTANRDENNGVKRLSILPDGRYKLACDNASREPVFVSKEDIAWMGVMVELRKDARPAWMKKR